MSSPKKTASPKKNNSTDRSNPDFLQRMVTNHLVYTEGKSVATATERDWFEASAHAVRDQLIEKQLKTTELCAEQDPKRLYYLSLEFLIGRTLSNAALNMGLEPSLRASLKELGQDLEEVEETEIDAALGNGGLGRLAACFLDSLATLDLPGQGYGIRYEYGMFNQRIKNGQQVERPDNWLRFCNQW
jgi:starch phosphorylase